ncbi:MAG: potassium channel family protein [Burkholderiaceae bacterium]|nr:potassium channel family protein [Burkholderiaceae bacterium]
MRRSEQDKKRYIARRGVVYSLVLCTLILGIGGVGFWLIDPQVDSLAQGLWLAFTTAATVGFGDVVPSTNGSRLFSVLVVLLGLAVLSLATASLAAIFVEKEVEAEEAHMEQALIREINLLREDLRLLREEVRQRPAPSPPPGRSGAQGPQSQ